MFQLSPKIFLSVSKLLADNDVLIEFHETFCFIKTKNRGGIILLKRIARGLYQVEGSLAAVSNVVAYNNTRSNIFVSPQSVSSVSPYPVSMLNHLRISNIMHSNKRLSNANNVQFNNEASKALFASYSKFVDYNLLHKRIGHLTVHALKQIMKQLNSAFDMNRDIKLEFCNACQFDEGHM